MKHEVLSLDAEFDDAIARVTQALGNNGFGVITRIDMDQTFQEKLGVEFPRYVILGACNPQLAHKAVSAVPEIGLLLPCNIVVEKTGSGVQVRIPDAGDLLGGAGLEDSPALAELASDAQSRLKGVAQELRAA
jgi:uncharacterized protein (DUF302 family)